MNAMLMADAGKDGGVMTTTINLFAQGLLKGLGAQELDDFMMRCHQKQYADGTNLFMENTEATMLYMIIEGGIELHFEMPKRENADTTIAVLKPGDAVGWSAVVPPHQYRLSGYTRGDTTLLQVDRNTLLELFEENHHLAYIFMRNIAELAGERVNHVQDKLAKILADEAVNGW